MKYISVNKGFVVSLGLFMMVVTSCERFLNPEQELYITEDRMYDDWYEYRAVEMGMYALQQELVEQRFNDLSMILIVIDLPSYRENVILSDLLCQCATHLVFLCHQFLYTDMVHHFSTPFL